MSVRNPADYGDLGSVPHDTLRAYSYLCARIGIEAGLLDELPHQPAESDQLVCFDGRRGTVFMVSRPAAWTRGEEERHLASMRRLLRSALE
jgi:hypothetical protein